MFRDCGISLVYLLIYLESMYNIYLLKDRIFRRLFSDIFIHCIILEVKFCLP